MADAQLTTGSLGGIARRAGGRSALTAVTGAGGLSLALIAFLGVMVPKELHFYIGPALITPIRLLILLALPLAVAGLFSLYRPLARYDYLYFGFSLWTVLCILKNYGMGGGLMRAGQFFLETSIIYLFCIVSLTTVARLRAFVTVYLMTIGAMLVLALIEQVTFRPVHWMVFEAFGMSMPGGGQPEVRMGIKRSRAIFDHAIMYGVFCAVGASWAWYCARSATAAIAGSAIVFAAALMSVSAGPLMALIVQYALISMEILTRRVKKRFKKLASLVIAGLATLHVVASRGLFALVLLVTFNPETAYYRRDIWTFGSVNIWRHPVFGMVVENWERAAWMNPSMDNFWLFQALHGGLPSVVMLIGAVAAIAWSMYRCRDADLPAELAGMRRAWAFSILGFMAVGTTVHFYSKMQPFFALMIGAGAAIAGVIERWRRAQAAEAALRAAEGGASTGAPSGSAPKPPRPRAWLA